MKTRLLIATVAAMFLAGTRLQAQTLAETVEWLEANKGSMTQQGRRNSTRAWSAMAATSANVPSGTTSLLSKCHPSVFQL